MKYKKEIEMFFTGMVIANVRREDGTSAGQEFFHSFPFETDEHRLRRAHKWADNRIALLEKYETPTKTDKQEMSEEEAEKFYNKMMGNDETDKQGEAISRSDLHGHSTTDKQ